MTRPAFALNWPPAALALCGAGILVLTALGLQTWSGGAPGYTNLDDAWWYNAAVLAAGALYAAALWITRTYPLPRVTLPAIIALGLAARLLVLAHVPLLSTDIFRYVWDGRVQNAGINPYRYLPADPALLPLRDPGPETRPGAIYPNINRADTAPTIYPPFAQFLFTALGRIAPGISAMKAAMMAFDLATLAILLRLLHAAARPPVWVLAWAWNPLPIWEFANEGHIDAPACAFIALALLMAARGHHARAGAALAAATLFKLLPIILFPAIWRRWDLRGPLVALALIVGSYAIYAGAGLRVFGYLGGYTQEEGLFDGRFLPLRILAMIALAASGTWFALGAGGAPFALTRALPAATPARTKTICTQALVLTALLLAAIAPKYPWYYVILLVPGTLLPTLTVSWVTITAPLLYFATAWPWMVVPIAPLAAIDLYRATHTPPRSTPDA